MKIIIKNGRVINPADRMDTLADVLVEDGRVKSILPAVTEGDADAVIDASGCWVMPGFIDMHVHLRDPGQTEKETIDTGIEAAVSGGFTTIVAMANTVPVVDNEETYQYVCDKAKKHGKVTVLQAGSITKGLKGEELSDLKGLIAAGCRVFSEDGKSVMNSALMRQAMKIIKASGGVILDHCEDKPLVEGGVVNMTESGRLSLPGISNAVEDIIAVRDIMLAKETGVWLHLCHCSTVGAEQYLYQAKEAGIRVSGEVCPHHFSLSCEDIPDNNDANYKMNPPLRTRADVAALREGISNGIFDCISTDHAPHTQEEKARSFLKAPFGIVGLETAAALTNSVLVNGGYLTPMGMAEKMSFNPSRILGISRGDISIGNIADIVVFDPKKVWTVDPDKFKSKGRNTPFKGKKLTGQVRAVLYKGQITKQ
ncbi:MAG: dihydroorotase [Lachnospiraceae bacterium]|uniref:Dihydroorotase n=1 Tax=Candidatus Weimeria bifida TaxID=2599074 RepID=A0A6N7IZW9_9FIRM|nr:dihydroorotase [Candidatus Weimeria bifida]RRF96491.1 MAG: dihydroorotase [Lachnospiraceae bacterium]